MMSLCKSLQYGLFRFQENPELTGPRWINEPLRAKSLVKLQAKGGGTAEDMLIQRTADRFSFVFFGCKFV